MFLDVTVRRNSSLIEAAIKLHQRGLITPNTYVLDLDRIVENAVISNTLWPLLSQIA
jgi:hypothetical protein